MYYKFNIVVIIAHLGEARSLFNLADYEEISKYPLLSYRKHNRIIVISGEGRFQAAAAVMHAKGLCEHKIIFWLNIGCAGHPSLKLGTVVQAGKIKDCENGRSWFPSTPFSRKIPIIEVKSFEKPVNHYEEEICYDMEASGFIELAQKDAIPEQLVVLKIICDNLMNPVQSFSFREIEACILSRKNLINTLVEIYSTKAAKIAKFLKPIELPWWLRTNKFTHSQRHQVKQLLHSYMIKNKNSHPPMLKIMQDKSSREILQEIRHQWKMK